MNFFADINWSPGMHDPDSLGWMNAALYFAVAVFLAYIYWRVRVGRAQKFELRFWLVAAITMAILAVNKVFDLQSLGTEMGRMMLGETGRRPIQAVAIIFFVLLTIGLGTFGAIRIRGHGLAMLITYAGLVYLITFIGVRGISLHQIDSILYHTALGSMVNVTIEFCGIAIVGIGAAISLRPTRNPRYQTFERTVRIK